MRSDPAITANPSSINTYLSEVRAAIHRQCGVQLAFTPLLKQFLLRWSQHHNVDNPQRIPLPIPRSLVKLVVEDVSLHRAQRLATLLAFNGLLRSQDYCSTSRSKTPSKFTLLRSDIRWDEHTSSYIIRQKRSKSDPMFQGRDFPFTRQPGEVHCPVKHIREYLRWYDANFPSQQHLPLLRLDDGRFLIRNDIITALRKHSAAVNIPPSHIASHSLRHGGAFELLEAGASMEEVIARGRWRGDSAVEMARHYGRFSVGRSQRISHLLRLSLPAAQPFITNY